MGRAERLYYSVANAILRVLLRSPLHGLRSRKVVLLEFRGRRSGRLYRIPVSYWERSEREVVCLTSASWSQWWRNLDGAAVVLWLHGRRREGTAALVGDLAERRSAIDGFFAANPQDVRHYPTAVPDMAEGPDTKVIEIGLA